ncbi:RNA polymerase-binding protein DksA [Pantoea sp. Ap-967]|uniref:RNA polymerase-binding protein DksA n=1 Tax=Pantoea sp. Ap-967 TaxID=2608362 RepID=UPI001F03D108
MKIAKGCRWRLPPNEHDVLDNGWRALTMTEQELLSQPDDAYMNAAQQAFFRELLLAQRNELQDRIAGEFAVMREFEPSSDPSDLGTVEEQRQWQLRLLEREKKLLDKIDEALERISRGEYGWCRETGEPIGLRRLLLRPTATLSIEAKERQERKERHMRES